MLWNVYQTRNQQTTLLGAVRGKESADAMLRAFKKFHLALNQQQRSIYVRRKTAK